MRSRLRGLVADPSASSNGSWSARAPLPACPAGSRSLTGTIQRSHDLLPAPAQRILTRLSVFAAPFTDAAGQVAGPDVGDALKNNQPDIPHACSFTRSRR